MGSINACHLGLIYTISTLSFVQTDQLALARPCTVDSQEYIADCRNRNLSDIPHGFPVNINTLLLRNNTINIKHLSSGLSRFSHLYHLDLSFNQLRGLKPRTFIHLTRLETLNLEGNHLPLNSSAYPNATFQGLRNLQSLKINNNINDEDHFSDMEYPGHVLAELSALEELFIDGIPSGVFGEEFQSLRKLRNLTLSGRIGTCNIPNISSDYFRNLKHLTYLNMTSCSISHIGRQALTKLDNITILDMSGNTRSDTRHVENILCGLQNSSVEILKLNAMVSEYATCTVITNLMAQHLHSTNLRELYFNDNYIVTAEKEVLSLLPKSLEVLSIRKSRLVYGTFFEYLNQLENVRMIDLSESIGSSVPVIHGLSFSLPPKLETFYCDDSTFRVAFVNVNFTSNNVMKISYRKNVITYWAGPVYGLNQLAELDMSENFCDRIYDGCLKGFPSLKILRANSNYLGAFLGNDIKGQVFAYSPTLEFLDLSLNRIQFLPVNVFRNLVSLKTLNLSENSLSYLKVKVSHMTTLTSLNLSSNQIPSLDHMFMSQLDIISKISALKVDLSDNPLICSCETLSFVKWMTQRKDMFATQQLYKCSSQSGWLYNENVFEILSQLQQKCTSHFGLAMGLLGSVTSFLCILCASILYRYRWKLRYLYYIARGRYRNVDLIQQGNDREYEYNAFISYADEDRDFALHMFIEKLEREGNLQLCLHHRDFIPGEEIAANILSAIQKSKLVVIVLSPNFLDSYWCRYEFEMARMEGLYTERNMVVLVKYQEVLPNLVPRDLLYMMHTQTFLEYPQTVDDQDAFWIALKDTLVAP
ncbi:toll-like receptor 4 [Haliotis rufescens]|uniref:toll-like receptor 4 n=1 Tax=Haliotis rufescens TaxID=6454 RepID=UPI00201F5563|nr:toll-like receptor 4 [Haliotis rufescens]